MKERPILMKGPLVLASLEDRKTQTRRIMKQAYHAGVWADGVYPTRDGTPLPWFRLSERGFDEATRRELSMTYPHGLSCPYGKIGDLLWVRETFSVVPTAAYRASTGVQQTINPCDPDDAAIYRAGWDRSDPGTRWRPSIHMPRWAARLTLDVTGVRVERVQDISEEDAQAEGCDREFRTVIASPSGCRDYHIPLSYRGGFANLWDTTTTTNPAYSWDANPWVWCISYKRIAQPA